MPELTAIKHRILRSYLEYWLPDALQRHENAHIIDGFCGPGEYKGGEIGSPLLALDILQRHIPDHEQQRKTKFLFIDSRKDRCFYLSNLIQQRTQFDITGSESIAAIKMGTFDTKVKPQITKWEKSGTPPLFAFLDPFGICGMPMPTIGRILKHEQSEVLITFMYEGLVRCMGSANSKTQERVSRLYGTEAWRSLPCNADRELELCNLYRSQLRSMGAKYTCLFRMKNQKNTVEYFLVFATHKRESLERMKDIFWEIDPVCGYEYSVYEQGKNPLHWRLFPLEPDYDPLRKQLRDRFQGTTVLLREIEEYLVETRFRITDYRTLLRSLEQTSRIAVISENRTRGIGDYVETDRISFL